eukprot:TRINITY_DN23372_c0_g1_i1.p2 TRINITY_DN23372_c0_g1~~TRINITY_DN23372_c0_g1_i1.p2  ORF type:complete len:205 (+),score=78.57 TRINITY_DN23372_c0_g1_i1:72-617(+)
MDTKRDLCRWVEQELQTKLPSLSALADGWHLVQLIDSRAREHPRIMLHKVCWEPATEEQRVANLTLLHNKLQDKGTEVFTKVARGNIAAIRELTLRVKEWCDGCDATGEYDGIAARSAAKAWRAAAARKAHSQRKTTPAPSDGLSGTLAKEEQLQRMDETTPRAPTAATPEAPASPALPMP